PPMMKAPTKMQQKKLNDLQANIDVAEDDWRKLQKAVAQMQHDWEASAARIPDDWVVFRDLAGRLAFKQYRDRLAFDIHGDLGTGPIPQFDGKSWLEAGPLGDFSFFQRFSMGCWIRPDADASGSIFSKVEPNDRAAGYNLLLKDGKIHLHFAKRWLDDAI